MKQTIDGEGQFTPAPKIRQISREECKMGTSPGQQAIVIAENRNNPGTQIKVDGALVGILTDGSGPQLIHYKILKDTTSDKYYLYDDGNRQHNPYYGAKDGQIAADHNFEDKTFTRTEVVPMSIEEIDLN